MTTDYGTFGINDIPTIPYKEFRFRGPTGQFISAGTAQKEMFRKLTNQSAKYAKSVKSVVDSSSKAINKNRFLTVSVDSTSPLLEQYRHYIEDGKRYITKHAGGIIGDEVKMAYFTQGSTVGKSWTALKPQTVYSKTNLAKRPSILGRIIKPSAIRTPLQRYTTPTSALPESWRGFLYRNNYGALNVTAVGRAPASHLIPSGALGGGGALMDVVAHLRPQAHLQGFNLAVARNLKQPLVYTRQGKWQEANKISITGLIEPFYATPYVFFHETGAGNLPQREFIAEGINRGLIRVSNLWDSYLLDGWNKMAIRNGVHQPGDFAESAKMETDPTKSKRIIGAGGLKPLPVRWEANWLYDEPKSKMDAMNEIIRKMFGSSLILWFAPPSMWWHYVGILSDLSGVSKAGIWSSTAILNWIKAMTLGMGGAAMQLPIRLTPKSRRRQFRKSLYGV